MVDYNILFANQPTASPSDTMRSVLQNQSAYNEFQQQPTRNALLQSQAEGAQLQNQAAAQENQAEQYKFQLQDLATDWGTLKPLLSSGDMTNANVAIAQRIQKIQQRGGDPSDTIELRDRINSGQITPEQAIAEVDGALEGARSAGILDKGVTSSAMAEFQGKAAAAGLQPGTPEYARAARVDLGLDARAGTVTGQERIATTPGMAETVASSESTIEGAKSGAKESAKLGVQAKMMPGIRSAIKAAEEEAASRGESLSEYKRAKAAMPGLEEVASKLKALADVATYTAAGKTVDLLAKELGFGATKGGTARASMESIIDNQVLPLLRDTFGAAFTAAEGERLRNTFLDPNETPEAKKARLDALIAQKYRNLETKERELGVQGDQSTGGGVDPALLEFMTPEERALFQ